MAGSLELGRRRPFGSRRTLGAAFRLAALVLTRV